MSKWSPLASPAMDLSGSVALVTGGARRVGRAISLALAGAGCDVFVHYGQSAAAAEETAAEIEALGRRAAIGSADLGDATERTALVGAATGALGPVQVLVNSASGFAADTVRDVTGDGWRRTMAVSLEAPVFLTQAMAGQLPAGLPGAVVNVTDWRTARPYPDHFSYTVAKGAVDAFTQSAAIGLAPSVRVNAVALGAILPPPGRDSGYLEDLAGSIPIGHVGGVDVVTDAVLFLLRNEFITGEIVRVDGGAHLA